MVGCIPPVVLLRVVSISLGELREEVRTEGQSEKGGRGSAWANIWPTASTHYYCCCFLETLGIGPWPGKEAHPRHEVSTPQMHHYENRALVEDFLPVVDTDSTRSGGATAGVRALSDSPQVPIASPGPRDEAH